MNEETIQVYNNEYDIFINPRLMNHSDQYEYRWEQCQSYPQTRVMIKRPREIKVSYMTESGSEFEQHLHNFHARMFLQQMDHLHGTSEQKWSLNTAKIDIVPEEEYLYGGEENLSTINYIEEEFERHIRSKYVQMVDD